jgi:hypothetical protein
MKKTLACISLLSLAACGDTGGTADDDGATVDAAASDLRTLDTCTTSIGAGVPAFYQTYFACSTITVAGDGTVTIASEDLPPHQSYYWPDGDPNHIDFDRSDDHVPNPNRLAQQSVHISIPPAPVAKGLTIDASLIDETAGTSDDEYPLGTIGVALDSVSLYTGTAGPGDQIDHEKYTFDGYGAHPSPDGAYHYHSPTPGPLEVMAKRGLGGAEVYGILCDGTVVLGCTELDGGAISGALDAQGGHVGDIADADATYFQARYHVHVCATAGDAFTPEIQYYTSCGR